MTSPERERSERAGAVERFMSDDHARLGALLLASARGDGTIDVEAYTTLKHELLRHIAIEEKVLLPDARARRGGEPLPVAERLRRDHGVIAKLLVRSPTPAIVDELRATLAAHDPLEEGPDGMYAACDALAGAEADELVAKARAVPRVPLAPYYDGPLHARKAT